jgi:hypothetical protein
MSSGSRPMIRKLPVAEIAVAVLAVTAGVGVYAWAHNDQGALAESKARGAEIVAALESYHGRHGTYPAELAALVPDHLPSVRQPTWGLERWRYRRFTAEDVTGVAVTGIAERALAGAAATSVPDAAPATAADSTARPDGAEAEVFFQLSVARNASGYPVLYYDFAAQRWVLNN